MMGNVGNLADSFDKWVSKFPFKRVHKYVGVWYTDGSHSTAFLQIVRRVKQLRRVCGVNSYSLREDV